MYRLKFVPLIIVLLLISPVTAAKKRCKPLLEKLHNIQALQRSGNSSKRSISLRNREDKARDNWWQCEQGRSKKTKKKEKKKRDSKTASYPTKGKNTKTKSPKSRKITASTPFNTSHAIVIKSKYQGDKKRAWLRYYQQPNQCIRAKSLSVFAACSENKQTQGAEFEKQYSQ